METNLLFGGNYFVPISQISLPLEAVFPTLGNIFQRNPFLQPVATDILFNGDDILSFRFSWKPLLKLEGSQYLQNNHMTSRGNRFLHFVFFLDTESNGSS